jgi:hypothetical protein
VALLAALPSPPSNGLHLGPFFIHAYGLAYVVAVLAAVVITRATTPPIHAVWKLGIAEIRDGSDGTRSCVLLSTRRSPGCPPDVGGGGHPGSFADVPKRPDAR